MKKNILVHVHIWANFDLIIFLGLMFILNFLPSHASCVTVQYAGALSVCIAHVFLFHYRESKEAYKSELILKPIYYRYSIINPGSTCTVFKQHSCNLETPVFATGNWWCFTFNKVFKITFKHSYVIKDLRKFHIITHTKKASKIYLLYSSWTDEVELYIVQKKLWLVGPTIIFS